MAGNHSIEGPNVFSDTERAMLGFSIAVFSLFATFGNALLWMSIVFNPSLRKIGNAFIFNLSVTDMIVGAWNMPITLVSVIVNDWLLPNWACVASAYIDNVVLFASVWTVAVCSFDRYWMLVHPHSYRSGMTKNKAIVMICAVWVFAMAFATVPLFGVTWATYSYSALSFSCGLGCANTGWGLAYCTVFTIFFVPIPLGFIIFFYSHIFRVSQKHGKKTKTVKKGDTTVAKQSHNLRAALMILIIIGMMMSCLLPISVLGMIGLTTGTGFSVKIFVGFHWLLLLNNAVNPIIYGVVNPVFRKAYVITIAKITSRCMRKKTNVLAEDPK